MCVKKRLGNSVWQFVTPESGGFIPGNNRTLNKATSLWLHCPRADKSLQDERSRPPNRKEFVQGSFTVLCPKSLFFEFRFRICFIHPSSTKTLRQNFLTELQSRLGKIIYLWANQIKGRTGDWRGPRGTRHCPLAVLLRNKKKTFVCHLLSKKLPNPIV